MYKQFSRITYQPYWTKPAHSFIGTTKLHTTTELVMTQLYCGPVYSYTHTYVLWNRKCITQTIGCASHKCCIDVSILWCPQLQNGIHFWWLYDNYDCATWHQTDHTDKLSVVQDSLHTWSVCSGSWSVLTSDLMLSLQQKKLCSDSVHPHWLLLQHTAQVPLVCKIWCSQSCVSEELGFMGCNTVWLVQCSWHFEGLLNPEDEATVMLRNDGNYLPIDRAQLTRGLESLRQVAYTYIHPYFQPWQAFCCVADCEFPK
jgi:hypothetical protein